MLTKFRKLTNHSSTARKLTEVLLVISNSCPKAKHNRFHAGRPACPGKIEVYNDA